LIFATIGFYLLTGLFGKSLGELDAFLPAGNTAVITSTSPTSISPAEKQ